MSLLLVDVADGVATLTLNNPAERNTLTAPMVAEIVAAGAPSTRVTDPWASTRRTSATLPSVPAIIPVPTGIAFSASIDVKAAGSMRRTAARSSCFRDRVWTRSRDSDS